MQNLACALQQSVGAMPTRKFTSAGAAFAAHLRHEMDRRGWTQTTLEIKSGVSQRAISNALRQFNSPGLDTCEKLARALGYPLWKMLVADMPLTDDECAILTTIVEGFLNGTAKERALLETLTDISGKYRSLR